MKKQLLAPNGKPSNLNATQYELVRTPAFKKWFGDWENDIANASKVVDDNGEPLVVWRGESKDFNKFDYKKLGSKLKTAWRKAGFYFSPTKKGAEQYMFFMQSGILKQFFLNIKNPYILDSKEFFGVMDWGSLPNQRFKTNKSATDYANSQIEIIKNKNHDGFFVTILEDENVVEIVAFEPNQIKLADGTNSLFDANSDDIRFAKGGKTKGDCYLVAGQLALEIKNKDIDYKGIPYLVHAEVKHSAIEGLRYGHAFIEDDENVYDFSNNREIIMPKQLYYYFGDINPRDKKKYRKYTFKEAREKMLSTGNYGCWDIEVDYGKGGRIFNDKELLEKWKKGERIGFTAIAHLKSKGLIPRADGVKRKSEKYMENGGRTISQTPAPKKDQVQGSDINKKSSSKDLSSAKLIKFDDKTLVAIKNKVQEHNEKYPDKKINLSSAKAVVRRGFGAYSSSHRPTISGGKPNSRVAWGLARLNAFTYKIVNGKSKSGKYSQDDDLIEELGFKVANYNNGGKMSKDIRCINCGWEWNKKDSELWDMYVCHKCGFDNTTFYTSIPVNNYSKGGKVESKNPDYLKMFLDL
jgi:hypothetical protein